MRRCLSSSSSPSYEHVRIKEDACSEFAVVEMCKHPVNSMSVESMEELRSAIHHVQNMNNIRGLVITSSTKAFSAGLDLNELVSPDINRLHRFWKAFQELHIDLYASPLVTIAAVNGSAIAGGCALSLCCDYRVMVEGRGKIGLNTVHTGLVAPYWVDKLYSMTIGHRVAEHLLSLGHVCAPHEALHNGIVDATVADDGDALTEHISTVMKQWLAIPDVGRRKTKALMRKQFIDEFHAGRDADTVMFTDIVTSSAFQTHILNFVQQLKKK